MTSLGTASKEDESAVTDGNIRVLEGQAALAWLDDPTTGAHLDDLYRRCPWSTRFQSREYVSISYRSYWDTHEPVVLFSEDGHRISGFFGLARSRSSGHFAVAGDHQTEYQGWLAEPDDGDTFLQAALMTLKRRYQPDVLRLRYLPAKAPISWMNAPLVCGAAVEQRRHRRPLFRLDDPERIVASLKKKANKSRLNRLKRQGEVKLHHLKTPQALEAVLDRIIAVYDLRQGAVNGVCPFADDPRKRQFHLDLMAHPGLMQASMLTVGDEIAAAHLGLFSGDEVAVGIYAYSPVLAKHSPGKFLMLMLGADLAAEGRAWIDLTPGGSWKDRFATDYDEVTEVRVVFSRSLARRRKAAAGCLAAARSSLAFIGVSPDDARRLAGRMRLTRLFNQTETATSTPTDDRLVLHHPCRETDQPQQGPISFRRNQIDDLLRIDPQHWPLSRQRFLQTCEEKLAEGHHVYTHVDKGRLVHVCWTTDTPPFADLPILPGNTVWLLDQVTSTVADPHEIARQCLFAILSEVAGQSDQVAIAPSRQDHVARKQAEALGFKVWADESQAMPSTGTATSPDPSG